MRVLVIDDEKRLAENLSKTLRELGSFAVDVALDGEEGLFLAGDGSYDLIVLDLMLPKLNGLQVVTSHRQEGHKTPILILTARDDKRSTIDLLNAGADDYLSKPFDLGEFMARVKALVRRGKGLHTPVLRVADLELNSVTREVFRASKLVVLTPMEYRVLEYLSHRAGAVISKTELLEHLYDHNWEKFSNVIEVYVSGLRRKIDHEAENKLIHTHRGQGYSLRASHEEI